MKNKHTPLPWKIDNGLSVLTSYEIWDDRFKENQNDYCVEEKQIANFLSKEDACFIVKACNAFYELKEMNSTLIEILKFNCEKIDKLGSVELKKELSAMLFKLNSIIKKFK